MTGRCYFVLRGLHRTVCRTWQTNGLTTFTTRSTTSATETPPAKTKTSLRGMEPLTRLVPEVPVGQGPGPGPQGPPGLKELKFSKYEGTGNDFIAIDNMASSAAVTLTPDQRQRMCNRKTGIGADGILELKHSQLAECVYKLMYYNADGNEGSLCGNGARCSLAFAQSLGLINLEANQKTMFEACDGVHQGGMLENGQYFVDMRQVALKDVKHLNGDSYFLDNGSPHHVTFVTDLSQVDVVGKGRKLRWEAYGDVGANINFVQIDTNPFSLNAPSAQLSGGCVGAKRANDGASSTDSDTDSHLTVRTYERGVEDETLACGTGACASAIVAYVRHQNLRRGVDFSADSHENSQANVSAMSTKTTFVSMKGGQLRVQFTFDGCEFSEIKLSGPVSHVFDGQIQVREN